MESNRALRLAHSHVNKDKAFYSHCWRDAKTQVKKSRIVDLLSAPKEAGYCPKTSLLN